jgi:uncharacterized repeat protein (TIGR03806 family)
MKLKKRLRIIEGVRFTPYWLFLVAGLLTIFSCSDKSSQDPDLTNIPAHGPHQKLSDYRLFKGDLKNLDPVDELLPYDLNTELFSDYSQKLRFVYIPEGESAVTSDGKRIEFPVGSLLVKNFYYEHDLNDISEGRFIIETRLLIHRETGWMAHTYQWNDEQSDATLLQVGGNRSITWANEEGNQRNVDYRIPTINDCGRCHSQNAKLEPLGPKIDNINKNYPYRNGSQNQILRWQEAGFLTIHEEPGNLNRLPVWDDPLKDTVEKRARAYLDVNCSNCHSAAGTARNSALFLEYEQDNLFHLGVCKVPVAAGSGSGGLKYNIYPGRPDESILLFRMESVKPQERMPEIGRTLIHEEAVKLIRQWIEEMELPSCD